MSEKQKWHYLAALGVAAEISIELSPFCLPDKVAICGSLRRNRTLVGDIEILFVPKIASEPDGLFDHKAVDLANREIEGWITGAYVSKRPSKTGIFSWGSKNKLAVHIASGIPVDLFSTTEENWFMALVIRTGPKDFNLRLIESASKRGLKVHAYGVFESMATSEKIVPKSEQEVLSLAGLPWIEPENRR